VIRLVLLIPTLDRSGAEKQLTLLATRLPRDEFDVHVVALTRGGPYADVLHEHEIPLTILDKRLKLDVGAWKRLRSTLSELRPDILHTWLFAANAYGRLAASPGQKTKVIVSERCVDSWKASWQLWLDRRLISRTDRLVGNSQSVVDFYVEQGFPAERTTVIYNGMDLPLRVDGDPGTAGFTDSTAARVELFRELGIPEDAKLVGFVGRLAKQKRINDLLWAMQVLRQADERAHLLLVGDGPERAGLEQFARDVECADHVHFLGHRNDADRILAALDAFWLASDFEGLSNSLMEAMAAGVPVVASNIPPNRELVTHGTEGYLVDVGDGMGFAQFAKKLIDESQLAEQMGAAGRSRIQNDFSVQKMVDAHITLYRDLLSE